MLTSLTLQNFKSFRDQTVELGPLTILIGANASGKSNLLDGLRFLHGIGRGLTIAEILRGKWEGGRQVWMGIRGGAAEVVYDGAGAERFRVESILNLGEVTLEHAIACAVDAEPHVVAERLVSSSLEGKHIFGTLPEPDQPQTTPRGGGHLEVWVRKEKGSVVQQTVSSLRSPMGQIQPAAYVDSDKLSAAWLLNSAFKSMLFLDITPSRMRGYVSMQTDQIGVEGENLSAVLYNLCKDEEARQELLDWLVELCAPELEAIDFITTELDDVMLAIKEHGGAQVSARSMSDGTLRFLGELVALKTAPEGSMLLMEEIENGLHPSRTHLLVQAMEQATQQRGVQIVATTHSAAVLTALSEETLRRAVVFGRSPEVEGTVARPLGDLPGFDDVLARRGIEHLFITRWLERAL